MGTNDATDTRVIDPVKLMNELNARPEIWLNVIQVMGEVTADELNDDPNGHANFQTLLAHAMSEHTSRFDDEGNETAWLDVYTDPNA
jgi:hypothetical protein